MNVKKMSDSSLKFARADLQETIDIQEEMNRKGFDTPKLGQYWDDYFAVVSELKNRHQDRLLNQQANIDRRQTLTSPCPKCGAELIETCGIAYCSALDCHYKEMF
jgi:N-acetyl-anhydromuramyl-L-alanine amidase AmpD